MDATETVSCDLLVIGSGAGGLAAAIAARKLGLEVLLVEKEKWIGGTTALSGGWLWVPGNPLAQRAGSGDSLDEARRYLRHELGPRYDTPRIEAFLKSGPEMVAFLERETEVRFLLGDSYPDYHPDAPGARQGGRALCPLPFDGRALGDRLRQIRPPVRELTLFGLKVGSGPDFRHFANAQRSLKSALYVAGRIVAHCRDVVRYGRDVLLMSGNALVGRLAKTAFDLGVPIWLSSPAAELVKEGGRVAGADILREGRRVRVLARRGVISAAGGFSHDPARRARLFAHVAAGATHLTLAAPGNTGDGLRMAESVGAAIEESYPNAASWMPLSRVPYRDGSFGIYPHSFERGKPGIIAVTEDGTRFANESNSYHDFVAALCRKEAGKKEIAAFLVCDRRFIKRYGLGIAKPFPVPLSPYLRSGYLKHGATLGDLARDCGIDAEGLAGTVAEFNRHAREGSDPVFARGVNAYNFYQGDADNKPNPCLAPIEQPPFYAVRIHPGDLGTLDGIRTDEFARALDGEGNVIPGLYAVGTDMASIFAGSYPGPGINLGPAMTFAYIAARHCAGVNTGS